MSNDTSNDDTSGLRAVTVQWLCHTDVSEDIKIPPREYVRDITGHASRKITDRLIESDC